MPLYRSYDLAKTLKPIMLGEGESVVNHGQKIFPEFFWTTFQGGRKAWRPNIETKIDKVNWSLLQGREVYINSDVDADGKGKEEFVELTRYLNEFHDIKAKFIKLPSFNDINDWYEEENGERYPKNLGTWLTVFLTSTQKKTSLKMLRKRNYRKRYNLSKVRGQIS